MDQTRRLILAYQTLNNLTYTQKLKNLFGSSLLAHWPLSETSGTVAVDKSGNNLHGAYVGPTLAGDTSPFNRPAPTFDGINDEVNIYSAALNAAFNTEEGAIFIFSKMASAVWADGVGRTKFNIRATASNYITFAKQATAGDVTILNVRGGTASGFTFSGMSSTGFNCYCVTWSKSNNRMSVYLNGYFMPPLYTLLGTWTGALDSARCKIAASGGGLYDKGTTSDVVIVSREATAAEVLRVAEMSQLFSNVSIIGDSISNAATNTDYPYTVAKTHNNGMNTLKKHASGGSTILSDMDTQVAASALDRASVIIIALGTNDDNAGNMTTLQAEAEENIAELKASNPNASIYWMNVLPRWTNNTGATPVDKANIRTAIAAACTAQSITCWDTFDTPWITAAQTSDGLHPTAAGQAAIAAEILARL